MCECIARVDGLLAQYNTRIELPWWTSSGNLTPFVQTMKVDTKKRGKPRKVFATFCPFCGELYADNSDSGSEDPCSIEEQRQEPRE
jgi:hypothetical protein